MSRPAERVLAFLEALQERPRSSGGELAERIGVEPRTIRRYATALRDLGIPVEAERGRHGGYRLRPGYRMPPLMLDEEEAAALVLGLAAARQAGLAAAPGVERAQAKLERVLPAQIRERAGALQEALGFTREPLPAAEVPAATLLGLAEAIRSRLRVRVRYLSRSGRGGPRELDPYGLVVHSGRWYLAAHDHRHGEPRTFRVDRIRFLEPAGPAAPPPEGFDPAAHVARSLARTPWRWEVEVLLETGLEEAARRVSPTWGELEPRGGRTLLRMRAESLPGCARALAGLGWRLEVLRPPELREELAALGRELLAAAEG